MTVFDELLASLDNLLQQLVTYGPRLLLAAALLLVGWLIAKLTRKASIHLLRFIRVDDAAEKSGIETFLLKGGVRFTTVTLIAETVYWFLFFVTIFLALDVLGLDAAKRLLGRVLYYLPNVFISAVILIFGSLVAKFVKALTNAYLNNVGVQAAEAVSIVVQISIVLFVVFVAFEQLAVDMKMLELGFLIGVGGLSLGVGLAIGLGGQDVAKRVLDKIYKTLS